jgi:hypothetical protein
MFLQFVVHAHAKSLPTAAAQANSNPPADNLKPRRSFMFQLNAAALAAMKFPEYPKAKAWGA